MTAGMGELLTAVAGLITGMTPAIAAYLKACAAQKESRRALNHSNRTRILAHETRKHVKRNSMEIIRTRQKVNILENGELTRRIEEVIARKRAELRGSDREDILPDEEEEKGKDVQP